MLTPFYTLPNTQQLEDDWNDLHLLILDKIVLKRNDGLNSLKQVALMIKDILKQIEMGSTDDIQQKINHTSQQLVSMDVYEFIADLVQVETNLIEILQKM
ncbi:unnamed protein product [Didymodactylos carnosus]|uniref:Uncharacterized protein n=1 Tax=Didymodactylos carnosus TaxID=1234261 RepID=A0A813Y8N9_9BILA|nr:unnamed protein product [Didymodactylos carnosus]CAF0880662.1 unnamed protein product [Didymodactylos carnosus]CAF3618043.1 unnamed protein product [Didymodactylos carnosus]CAF3666910.1 unnamed protein product [Didymodactylos carnosus]